MENYLELSRRYKKFKFNEIQPEILEYLHKTDLEILKEILKIFNAHNLRYVIVGGTLLGAVTRGGFIPWDDDIDIAVFEEDYQDVKKYILKELPKKFILQCEETEPKYYHEWIKAIDLNSEVIPSNNPYSAKGVWVDIYKMTLIKRKEIELLKAKQHKNYLLKRFQVGDITEQELNKRIKENKLEEKIEQETLKAAVSKDNEEIYLICSASKPFIEKQYVFPLQKYNFEGLKLTSFNDAETYLLNHYGNGWKNLPLEEDRYISIKSVKVVSPAAPPHVQNQINYFVIGDSKKNIVILKKYQTMCIKKFLYNENLLAA